MKRLKMFFNEHWIAIAFSVLASVIVVGCKDDDKDDNSPQATVSLRDNATLGKYLVDADGKTLYIFTLDVKGNSACNSANCLNAWPIYYEPDIIVGQGLNKDDFGTITRSDGQMQTTYQGWPLYYFVQDVSAGDTKGENVNKVWFVAKPDYTIGLANQGSRQYLVDAQGRTLYLFTNDTPGVSACSGGCVGVWPLFAPESVVAPSLLNSADFQTVNRADGQKQLAYKGIPLYYYANDAARGDTLGGGVNNKWYTIAP